MEAVTQPIFIEAATRKSSSQSSTNKAVLSGFELRRGLMCLYLMLVSMWKRGVIANVAQARRKLHPQEVKKREHHIGVAGRICRMLFNIQRCFVIQNRIQGTGRFPDAGRRDPNTILRKLVRCHVTMIKPRPKPK